MPPRGFRGYRAPPRPRKGGLRATPVKQGQAGLLEGTGPRHVRLPPKVRVRSAPSTVPQKPGFNVPVRGQAQRIGAGRRAEARRHARNTSGRLPTAVVRVLLKDRPSNRDRAILRHYQDTQRARARDLSRQLNQAELLAGTGARRAHRIPHAGGRLNRGIGEYAQAKRAHTEPLGLTEPISLAVESVKSILPAPVKRELRGEGALSRIGFDAARYVGKADVVLHGLADGPGGGGGAGPGGGGAAAAEAR